MTFTIYISVAIFLAITGTIVIGIRNRNHVESKESFWDRPVGPFIYVVVWLMHAFGWPVAIPVWILIFVFNGIYFGGKKLGQYFEK